LLLLALSASIYGVFRSLTIRVQQQSILQAVKQEKKTLCFIIYIYIMLWHATVVMSKLQKQLNLFLQLRGFGRVLSFTVEMLPFKTIFKEKVYMLILIKTYIQAFSLKLIKSQ
jgi:hypothetical protein